MIVQSYALLLGKLWQASPQQVADSLSQFFYKIQDTQSKIYTLKKGLGYICFPLKAAKFV